MIISCPSCQKRYLIDESILSEQGREVRCGVCATTWTESLKPAVISISGIEVDSVFNDGRLMAKKKARFLPNLFFALTLLTVVITLGLMARSSLLNAVPSLKPLYEHLGVAPLPAKEGLSLGSLTPFKTMVQGKPALVIKGVLLNGSVETREVSELKISLYGPCQDAKGWKKLYHSLAFLADTEKKCEIDHFKHHLSQSRLMPGENLAFETLPRILGATPTSIEINF